MIVKISGKMSDCVDYVMFGTPTWKTDIQTATTNAQATQNCRMSACMWIYPELEA